MYILNDTHLTYQYDSGGDILLSTFPIKRQLCQNLKISYHIVKIIHLPFQQLVLVCFLIFNSS